jgi:hypothetical protein
VGSISSFDKWKSGMNLIYNHPTIQRMHNQLETQEKEQTNVQKRQRHLKIVLESPFKTNKKIKG